jgi:hypothetical protein
MTLAFNISLENAFLFYNISIFLFLFVFILCGYVVLLFTFLSLFCHLIYVLFLIQLAYFSYFFVFV